METLINIWNTYKGDVIPVIVTGVLVILSALFVFVASRIKTQAYKNEANSKMLAEIQAKESVEPSVNELKDEVTQLKEIINVLKDGVNSMADLFNTAFQNSALSPETKSELNNLCLRVKNGTSEDVIKNLEEEITKYKELYESTKAIVENTKESVEEITATEIKRVRR